MNLLAIKATEQLWASTERYPAQVAAADLVGGLPADAWVTLSMANGAKGPRPSDWAWLPVRPLRAPGMGDWSQALGPPARTSTTSLNIMTSVGVRERRGATPARTRH